MDKVKEIKSKLDKISLEERDNQIKNYLIQIYRDDHWGIIDVADSKKRQ